MAAIENVTGIVETLRNQGMKLLSEPIEPLSISGSIEVDAFLENLEAYPHFFVLGCVMNRNIRATRAFSIPYRISKEIGGAEFHTFLELNLATTEGYFREKGLHRYGEKMAGPFYHAVQRIHDQYGDDASNIWRGNPSSATIVYRFLQFEGVGPKIATMTANILARDYKVPMSDHYSIDISVDSHVNRVFKRLGLVAEAAGRDEIIYRARALNPDYPGVLDLPVWDIGRKWCHPRNPECASCYLAKYCPSSEHT